MFIIIKGQVSNSNPVEISEAIQKEVNDFVRCNYCYYKADIRMTPNEKEGHVAIKGLIECSELSLDAEYVQNTLSELLQDKWAGCFILEVTESRKNETIESV